MADGKKEQVQQFAPTGQTAEIMAGRIVAAGLADGAAAPGEELIVEACAVEAQQLEAHRRPRAARRSSVMLACDAVVTQTFAAVTKLMQTAQIDQFSEQILAIWTMVEAASL